MYSTVKPTGLGFGTHHGSLDGLATHQPGLTCTAVAERCPDTGFMPATFRGWPALTVRPRLAETLEDLNANLREVVGRPGSPRRLRTTPTETRSSGLDSKRPWGAEPISRCSSTNSTGIGTDFQPSFHLWPPSPRARVAAAEQGGVEFKAFFDGLDGPGCPYLEIVRNDHEHRVVCLTHPLDLRLARRSRSTW